MVAQQDVLEHYRQTLACYHQEHLLAFGRFWMTVSATNYSKTSPKSTSTSAPA